jgi:hypothetical protein
VANEKKIHFAYALNFQFKEATNSIEPTLTNKVVEQIQRQFFINRNYPEIYCLLSKYRIVLTTQAERQQRIV